MSSLGGLFLYMNTLDKALKAVGGKRKQNYRHDVPIKYLEGSDNPKERAEEIKRTAKAYKEGKKIDVKAVERARTGNKKRRT